MIHNVYRNNYISLALALKDNVRSRDLCHLIVRIHREGRVFDWDDTGYLYYPPERQVRGSPEYYARCREFQTSSKGRQRDLLSEFVHIPEPLDTASEGPFVVRPQRHSGGDEFYVEESHQDAEERLRRLGGGYASALVDHDRECRAFFVGGEHISTMEKRLYRDPEPGEDPDHEDYGVQITPSVDDPWNRSVCDNLVFFTRGDRVGYQDPLQGTGFYDDVRGFLEEYPFDLAAIDVGVQDGGYTVFELNQAPRLTVESTLNPVAEAFVNLR